MFTRIATMTLKPNASGEFTQLLEQKIVPLFRDEPGFQDLMVFVVPGGPDLLILSIWDSKEDAESYEASAYPNVLRRRSSPRRRATSSRTRRCTGPACRNSPSSRRTSRRSPGSAGSLALRWPLGHTERR